MVVTIHQPEHMPWLGFFHKMARADVYVLLDTVQFTKNNWQNRNQFIDRQGNVFWLSVPVQLKGHTESSIAHMKIDYCQPWQRKYLGRLEDCYRRHPYFSDWWPRVRAIIDASPELLVDINLPLIQMFREAFGFTNRILLASELGVEGERSSLLAGICERLGASVYLSGPSGKNYLDVTEFTRRRIAITYHEFQHPVYDAPKFSKFLSAWDLLMNQGPQSAAILGVNA